ELQNVLEYVFVQINSRVIGVEHLPPYLRERGKDMEISSIAEMEEKLIRKALAETGGNKNKAARLLGIPRTTLWRKIKKYGISVPPPLERTRE
ncbi:MAG: Fis family transcriptional regulator, partial [Candidatus Hydrothermae bacterium]|nr:Fis family transcriptional regulator [Candidatus Hydrothermae bacterium]